MTNYNDISNDYDKCKQDQWRIDIEKYTITEYLKDKIKGKRVLDIPCGSGVYSNLFYTMGAKEVIGIDISQEMVKIAKKNSNNSNSNFITCDAEKLDQIKGLGKFDIIVAIFLFNYAQTEIQLDNMVRNIKNLLKDDGILLIFNDNILQTDYTTNYSQYNFEKSCNNNIIKYTISNFEIINYKISPNLFFKTFQKYFKEITIKTLQTKKNVKFYELFHSNQPFICLTCN
jgi:2-polyprenyl-3-methyl-5-hydroxy-6-metoxy-1,4-benzoquinol methylase